MLVLDVDAQVEQFFRSPPSHEHHFCSNELTAHRSQAANAEYRD